MSSSSRPVALVTGASRGLGAVIARLLAERGYDLVVNAREDTALQAAAASLRKLGGHVIPVAGSVTEPSVRERLVESARGLGALRVLVNNASELGGIGPLTEVEPVRLARVLQVNAIAPIALSTLALSLLARRGGLIVNVSSDAALGGYPGWGAYGASKAALELLTRTLANELAENVGAEAVPHHARVGGDDDGAGRVAAVTVDPGDMRTRMHQEAFPGEDISDRPLPQATLPFWEWLFDQPPSTINGLRFMAREVAAAQIAARHDTTRLAPLAGRAESPALVPADGRTEPGLSRKETAWLQ